MPTLPWFKFFANDFLLDPDVDALPPEAEALLIRMWCVCHREGSCPVDPETLARKTLRSLQYVLQCKPHCDPFFELRDGRLYSRRMQEEKRRSEQARENANARYKQKGSADRSADGSASGRANRNANGTAQSQSQSQSQDQNQKKEKEKSLPLALTRKLMKQKSPDPILVRIYEIYPRKVARGAAYKAIDKALARIAKEKRCSREDAADFLYQAVVKFRESPAGKKGEHTPHPATFMNQDRFFDDPQEWWKTNGNGSSSDGKDVIGDVAARLAQEAS